MSWRTPCVDEPEMWTGKLADSREEAARICVTVCKVQHPEAFAACKAQAEREQPDLGVYAGVDYGPKVTRTCEGPGCDNPLPSEVKAGRARRFCGANCRHNFNYEKRAARVKTCVGCGAEFHWSHQSEAQWAARKFCSLRCTGAARAAA